MVTLSLSCQLHRMLLSAKRLLITILDKSHKSYSLLCKAQKTEKPSTNSRQSGFCTNWNYAKPEETDQD